MSDIIKCQVGQVWMFEDGGIDKYNIDDREFAVRGRRPVVIVAISGYRAVCIPFTSSRNNTSYRHIGSDVMIEDRLSYGMFDSIFTCGVGEFSYYMGVLKQDKLDKIIELVIAYLKGEIEFIRGQGYIRLPSYMVEQYRQPNLFDRIREIGIDTIVNEDSSSEPKTTSLPLRKYSDELIEFVLDKKNSTKDAMTMFGLTAKQVYNIRQYYRKK